MIYDLLNRQKLANQIILWLGATFAHITIHNRQKSSCTFFTALPSPNNFIEKVTVHYLFSRKIQGQYALLLSLRIKKQFPFDFSGFKRNDHVINDSKLKKSEKLRLISKYKFDESSKVSDQTVWIRTRSQSQRGRDQRHLHVDFETITMEFDLRLFGRKHFPFILPQLLSCSQRMQLI